MRPALIRARRCDAVFGATAVPPVPDARPADAAVDTVTGRHRVRYTTNDANHMPILQETSLPLALLATLDDGSLPAIVYDPQAGTFSFALAHAGQAYRLVVARAGTTTEYQS